MAIPTYLPLLIKLLGSALLTKHDVASFVRTYLCVSMAALGRPVVPAQYMLDLAVKDSCGALTRSKLHIEHVVRPNLGLSPP